MTDPGAAAGNRETATGHEMLHGCPTEYADLDRSAVLEAWSELVREGRRLRERAAARELGRWLAAFERTRRESRP